MVCIVNLKGYDHLVARPELTLLEVLELHNIPVEYQCREGYCGSCRMKLLAGEINYLNEPIAFLRDQQILACCCIPNSDISIEFLDDTE